MNTDFEKECIEQVKRIANHLDDLASGENAELDALREELEELEDNEPDEPDQREDEPDEDFDKRYEEYENAYSEWEDKQTELTDRIEELENENSLETYFEDALDISYIVDRQKRYESVRVWVTVGGPSIYVDTDRSAVVLNWGGTHAEWGICTSTRDAIDAYWEEMFDMM